MNKNIYLYTKVNWGDYTKVKQNRFLRQKLLLEIRHFNEMVHLSG